MKSLKSFLALSLVMVAISLGALHANATPNRLKVPLGIHDAATCSVEAIVKNLAEIKKMKLAGMISEKKAALLIDMQKNALTVITATSKSLHILIAQNSYSD